MAWREWAVNKDGKRYRSQKSRYVVSQHAAMELAAKVGRALEADRAYVPDATPDDDLTSFDVVGLDWLRAKKVKGMTKATLVKYSQALSPFGWTARKELGYKPDSVLPWQDLTLPVWTRIGLRLQVTPKYEFTRYRYSASIVVPASRFIAGIARGFHF